MSKKILYTIIIVALIAVVGGMTYYLSNNENIIPLGGRSDSSESTTFITVSAGQSQLLKYGAARLERIIVGKGASGAKIQLYDANVAPAGSSSKVFYIESDSLLGAYEMGIDFSSGIVANVSNQTYALFVITPR